MPDKLFDIVLAALKKIPHVKVKGANRIRTLDSNPLTMYNQIICAEAGQIIVDFDTTWEKILGIIPWSRGPPLASLDDVQNELRRIETINYPIGSTEYFLAYQRPYYDGQKFKRGSFELVIVGTLPFFNPEGKSNRYGDLAISSNFFPDDLHNESIHSQLIDHHLERTKHLSHYRKDIDSQ